MAMPRHTEYAVQKMAQLENALLGLMALRPYQDITVTDICREAGIPRRTFYHYFESKEAVLESIIEALMRECFLNTVLDFQVGKEKMHQRFVHISFLGRRKSQKAGCAP